MSNQLHPSDPRTHDLAEVLDVASAGTLAACILRERGGDLELNASRVSRIGTQCVQVILAARTSWASDGHRFSIVAPSVAFADALRLLGLALMLDQPLATVGPR